jgi:DNA-damage-inducible protein D
MSDSSEQQLFAQATIRRVWHNDTWYYSVIDVIAVLSESPNPRNYWNMLKARLKDEGASATLAELVQLRLKAADGRFRQTDTASRETLLRIIQSVPSPRAEPFKEWLAQVGEERIQEIEHPEAALERVRQAYLAKGYTPEWVEARIRSDLVRNDLTDEWKTRGAREGMEFAILTSEIHNGTFALSVAAHKQYKLLPKRTNLRDHMTPLELALISLGEATAAVFHRDRDSQGFDALQRDAKDAGTTAGKAREVIEQDIGRPVVSSENYLALSGPRQRKNTELQAPADPEGAPDRVPDDPDDGPTQLPLFEE